MQERQMFQAYTQKAHKRNEKRSLSPVTKEMQIKIK